MTARHVHAHGIGAALEKVPEGAKTFITFDCDAFDPSLMPGVGAPVPGGLGYWHVVALFEGLAPRTQIAGFDIVELVPERDIGGLSALTAARLVTLAIGAIDRSTAKSVS
ncbi:MAG: arginase family protein [Hyphomicrobiaceae bacterium]